MPNYENDLLRALRQQATSHSAESHGHSFGSYAHSYSAPSSPHRRARQHHGGADQHTFYKQQAEDDNTCFVLDTLMDAITAVTTKGAISDDEWEGEEHCETVQPTTFLRSQSMELMTLGGESLRSNSNDSVWSYCSELAALARDDGFSGPNVTHADKHTKASTHADTSLWRQADDALGYDARPDHRRGRAGASSALSQPTSQLAYAQPFRSAENLSSLHGHAEVAPPSRKPLPSQLRAPGTPTRVRSQKMAQADAMPADPAAAPQPWSMFPSVHDAFKEISSPLLLSTSRSSAMSSSTSALPPLSKYGNELLAEKQSYVGPADAVLIVKAAAFVPASAPTTPLMGSVESLDELQKEKPTDWCQTTVCKHAPNCERAMKGKCRFYPCSFMRQNRSSQSAAASPRNTKKNVAAKSVMSPSAWSTRPAESHGGPRMFGNSSQRMPLLNAYELRRGYQ